KSEGQGIRKQKKYCERSSINRIGSFFLFFPAALNNITYDSHLSLFSNWKSHTLNTVLTLSLPIFFIGLHN
ncbi:hypothetical protein, partial [Klebsiella quasipneumoniae]|uniref:hypothetical protein n=1 Tax=Klebsiella quasipneumoniae TaxID=1463165 RepID=UPI001C5275AA